MRRVILAAWKKFFWGPNGIRALFQFNTQLSGDFFNGNPFTIFRVCKAIINHFNTKLVIGCFCH